MIVFTINTYYDCASDFYQFIEEKEPSHETDKLRNLCPFGNRFVRNLTSCVIRVHRMDGEAVKSYYQS